MLMPNERTISRIWSRGGRLTVMAFPIGWAGGGGGASGRRGGGFGAGVRGCTCGCGRASGAVAAPAGIAASAVAGAPAVRALPPPRPANSSIRPVAPNWSRAISAFTAPRSSTRMRSDSWVRNSRFCSTSNRVRPRLARIETSVSAISSIIDGWMPSVGSSSRNSTGSAIRQRATARICCSPPLSTPPWRSSSGARRGKSATIRSMPASALASPVSSLQAKCRFSRTVRLGKMPRPWGT